MKYKKLLVKLLPYFIASSSIYAQENKYLKMNIGASNYLPKIETNRNISTLKYNNIFKLNKVDFKLNISKKLNNIFTNCYVIYKLNNKLNLLIDKGCNNKLINFLATYKLSLLNKFSVQIGYTLLYGLHLGLENNIDNTTIDQLTSSLASRINNNYKFYKDKRIYIDIDEDLGTVYTVDEIAISKFKHRIKGKDIYLNNPIIVDETSSSDSSSDEKLEDNSSKELESSVELKINEGLEDEFKTIIKDVLQNNIDSVVHECLPPRIESTIHTITQGGYTNNLTHHYTVLEVLMKPVVKILTIVVSLDKTDKIIDIVSSKNYTIFEPGRFEAKDYIYEKSQFYKVLKRAIKPIISIETFVKELNNDEILTKNSDITIYFNEISKNTDDIFESTLIKLNKKIRKHIIEREIDMNIIEQYNEKLQKFITDKFINIQTISMKGILYSNNVISEESSTNRNSSYNN